MKVPILLQSCSWCAKTASVWNPTAKFSCKPSQFDPVRQEFYDKKAEKYDLEIGSHSFIPGFEEQLVGMKVGEEKDITTTFPENYGNEDLTFTINFSTSSGNPLEIVLHITIPAPSTIALSILL